MVISVLIFGFTFIIFFNDYAPAPFVNLLHTGHDHFIARLETAFHQGQIREEFFHFGMALMNDGFAAR